MTSDVVVVVFLLLLFFLLLFFIQFNVPFKIISAHNYETGQSVGGAKMAEPQEKPPGTPMPDTAVT